MRYRCFCMTDDDRIITGAFIEATDMLDARAQAQLLWQHVPDFHHAEIWLDRLRLSGRRAGPRRTGCRSG